MAIAKSDFIIIIYYYLCGSVAKALDKRAIGCGLKPRPNH